VFDASTLGMAGLFLKRFECFLSVYGSFTLYRALTTKLLVKYWQYNHDEKLLLRKLLLLSLVLSVLLCSSLLVSVHAALAGALQEVAGEGWGTRFRYVPRET
jgi:hypothetical protein